MSCSSNAIQVGSGLVCAGVPQAGQGVEINDGESTSRFEHQDLATLEEVSPPNGQETRGSRTAGRSGGDSSKKHGRGRIHVDYSRPPLISSVDGSSGAVGDPTIGEGRTGINITARNVGNAQRRRCRCGRFIGADFDCARCGMDTVLEPPLDYDLIQEGGFEFSGDSEKPASYKAIKERAAANIEAIKVLCQIEEEERSATAEEQKVLARFTGWGGLGELFSGKAIYREEYGQILELLSNEERDRAKNSTQNAYYTPPYVISAMWEGVRRLGFEGGLVWEPAAGKGDFFGAMPPELRESTQRYGTEIDPISARIARQLYQTSHIDCSPTQETNYPDEFFDLVISNIPFGNTPVFDKEFQGTDRRHLTRSLHDYFIAKSLAKTRPGGLVAVLTSRYTMDKLDESTRWWIASQSDLVGAIRLPNDTFANSNVQITSDILFFRKRVPGEEPGGESFTEVKEVSYEPMMWQRYGKILTGQDYGGPDKPHTHLNQYFIEHPEAILGTPVMMAKYPRRPEVAVLPDDRDMQQALPQALANHLPKDIARAAQPRCGVCKAFLTKGQCNNPRCPTNGAVFGRKMPPGLRQGSTVLNNDQLYKIEERKTYDDQGREGVEITLIPLKTKGTAEQRVRGLIVVREAARRVLRLNIEGSDDDELQAAQNELNQAYDEFAKEFGPIHGRRNYLAFRHDPDLGFLMALEELDEETGEFKKAPIFFRRTIGIEEAVKKADTAKDALLISLNETGRISWERMEELTGRSRKELQEELEGQVFLNPSGRDWETGDKYLSGNVREKLQVARRAAEIDPIFESNVIALERVLPADLTVKDIDLELGMGWLPPDILKDFSRYIYELENRENYGLEYEYVEALGEWVPKRRISSVFLSRSVINLWATERLEPHEIFERTINGKLIEIYDTIEDEEGNTKRVLNEQQTVSARAVQAKLQETFREWVWSDPERADQLLQIYNDKFNSYVPRQYDGRYLTLPGQAADMFEMRPHQKNAVARIIQQAIEGENSGLFHIVGAGKTSVMIASSMEMKRMGVRSKIMHCIPNHMLEQYAEDFNRQYPGANLLLIGSGDLSPKQREETLARIATGEWDSIIITHSAFERIPVGSDTQAELIQQEIDTLNLSLAHAKANGASRDTLSVRKLEQARDRLETRLQKQLAKGKRDEGLTWEELGVDHLFVDEADEVMANLGFHSRHNIAGLGNNSNNRKSLDLLMKTQHLKRRCKCGAFLGASGICKRCGDRTQRLPGTITLSTGTPVRNTLAQMYVFQKFLQPELLEKMGLQHFDAWFSMFGRAVTKLEMNPSGKGWRLYSRVASFANVADLLRIWLQNADMQLDPDELGLNRPELVGGEQERVNCPATPRLMAFIDECDALIKNPPDDMKQGIHLYVVGQATKAALDMRLVDPNTPDEPNSKVNIAVRKMLEIYRESTGVQVEGLDEPQNMAQMVFLDLSTPPSTPEVTTESRRRLVAAGVGVKEAYNLADRLIAARDMDEEELKKLLRGQQVSKDDEDTIWRLLSREGGDPERYRVLLASLLSEGQAALIVRDAYRKRFLDMEELEKEMASYGLNRIQIEMVRARALRDNFNLYDDMKLKLIQAGVPEKEIAYIHDANSDEEKLELFDKVNRGEVRFLFGSTAKMGAGTNAQRRLIAAHHMDCPWRPRDLAQRDGRILRQGNLNKKVRVLQYATERSFDAYRWSLVETKARFAAQVLNGDLSVRSAEDVDEMVLNYTQMRAMATGNPIFMEQVQLDAQVRDLDLLRRDWQERKVRARRALNRLPEQIDATRRMVARLEMAQLSIDQKQPFRLQGANYAGDDKKFARELTEELARWRGQRGKTGDLGEMYGRPLRVVGSENKEESPVVQIQLSDDVVIDVSMGNDPGKNFKLLKDGFNSVPRQLADKRQKIARMEADIPEYAEVVRQPFEYQGEYNRLLTRQQEVEKEIARLQKEDEEKLNGSDVVHETAIESDWSRGVSAASGTGDNGNASLHTATTTSPSQVEALPQSAGIHAHALPTRPEEYKQAVRGLFEDVLNNGYRWSSEQQAWLQTAADIVGSGDNLVGLSGRVHPRLQGAGNPARIFTKRSELEYISSIVRGLTPKLPDEVQVNNLPRVQNDERRQQIEKAFDAFASLRDWTGLQHRYIETAREMMQAGRQVYDEAGYLLHPDFESISPDNPFAGADAQMFRAFVLQFDSPLVPGEIPEML